MTCIVQVLLCSTLFLAVFCHPEGVSRHHFWEYDQSSRLNNFNPISLLEAAARLAYPASKGVNNVIGRFLDRNNRDIPPYLLDLPGQGRRGISKDEARAMDFMADLLNYLQVNRENSQDSYESISNEIESEEDISITKADDKNSVTGNDNHLKIGENVINLEPTTTSPFISGTDKHDNIHKVVFPISEESNKENIDDIIKDIFTSSPSNKGITNTENEAPALVNAVPNQVSIPTSNSGTQGIYLIPVSSLNSHNQNNLINGGGVPGGILLNLQTLLSPVVSPIAGNNYTPGNVALPAISVPNSITLPNLIYAILNPSSYNPETNMANPINTPTILLNKQEQKPPESNSSAPPHSVYNSSGVNGESSGLVPNKKISANEGTEESTKI